MTNKPNWSPNLRWTANPAGQMTREAQQLLRAIIDTLFSRTGGATSAVVTGAAGAADELAKWDAAGDLVTVGDAAAARTLIGAQQSDALLTAIAALSVSAGGFIRTTGTDTVAAQAIVGTVSQSGGTPTGAIMEYGSNANGDYVRFANGVQVCWASGLDAGTNPTTASGNVFIDTATQATFAATFSAAPTNIVSFTKRSSGSGVGWTGQGSGTNASTTQTFPVHRVASTNGWNGSWAFIAIGRWFN